MSLILEALKKSEARRQLGEAPGIGTPFTVARRRRSPLPIIVAGIVVAAAFGWYYLGTGPANAPGTSTASMGNDKASAATANGATARPANGTVTALPRPNSPLPPRPATMPGGRPAPANLGPGGGAAPSAEQIAARQQRLAAATMNPAPAQAAGAGKPEPPVPTPAAPGPKPTVATAAPPPMATAVPQPAPPQTTSAPLPPATAPAAPATAPAASTPAPPVPIYYELPYNVRKDLPPLNVTMHVYAATPAQRFVVVDGERKGEGESLKDGLTLREIRNDGIILEFRGQQFFYPRPGR